MDKVNVKANASISFSELPKQYGFEIFWRFSSGPLCPATGLHNWRVGYETTVDICLVVHLNSLHSEPKSCQTTGLHRVDDRRDCPWCLKRWPQLWTISWYFWKISDILKSASQPWMMVSEFSFHLAEAQWKQLAVATGKAYHLACPVFRDVATTRSIMPELPGNISGVHVTNSKENCKQKQVANHHQNQRKLFRTWPITLPDLAPRKRMGP